MQTSISLEHTTRALGMIDDEGIRDVFSGIVATDSGAPGGVDMGRGVFNLIGTDGEQEARMAKGAVALTAYEFRGVAARDASAPHTWSGTNPGSSDYNWTPGQAFPVIRLGRVVVWSETAVDPSKRVYVRVIAVSDEVAGDFRATPDAGDCILLAGARWRSTSSGAGLVVLELCYPSNASSISVDVGTTAGDLLVFDGTKWTRLAKGTDGQVLKMVSGSVAWAADAT